MESSHLRDLLWYSGIALDAALAMRLVALGLVRRYPVLFVYTCAATVRGCVLASLLHSRKLLGFYGPAYFVTQALVGALYFLLIIELYSLMLAEFPGIRRLGRIVLFSTLIGVGGGFSLLARVNQQTGTDNYPLLSFLALQQRSIFLALSALALILLLFVVYYQISIRRNVRILYAGFAGYFLADSLMFTLRQYFGDNLGPIRNLVGSSAYLVALMAITLFFSKAGETESQPISIFVRRDPELENALALQLQGFNQVLLKALK